MTADLEFDELRLGQRGHCDQSSVSYIPGRALIFFPDIRRRECRQILIGFRAAEMKTADHELEILDLHLRGEETNEDVGVARSKTAIHGCGDVVSPSKLIEAEGIFREERDVDDILPALDNRLERVEAHMPGHGGDHQIRIADYIAHGFGTAKIGDHGAHAVAGRQGFESILV